MLERWLETLIRKSKVVGGENSLHFAQQPRGGGSKRKGGGGGAFGSNSKKEAEVAFPSPRTGGKNGKRGKIFLFLIV